MELERRKKFFLIQDTVHFVSCEINMSQISEFWYKLYMWFINPAELVFTAPAAAGKRDSNLRESVKSADKMFSAEFVFSALSRQVNADSTLPPIMSRQWLMQAYSRE